MSEPDPVNFDVLPYQLEAANRRIAALEADFQWLMDTIAPGAKRARELRREVATLRDAADHLRRIVDSGFMVPDGTTCPVFVCHFCGGPVHYRTKPDRYEPEHKLACPYIAAKAFLAGLDPEEIKP
jgi:hypothetical protein